MSVRPARCTIRIPEEKRTFTEDPAAIRNGFFTSIAEGVGGGVEMIGLLPTTTIFLATAPTDLRNYSERVIIPSASRGSMESMADVAGFVLYDSE